MTDHRQKLIRVGVPLSNQSTGTRDSFQRTLLCVEKPICLFLSIQLIHLHFFRTSNFRMVAKIFAEKSKPIESKPIDSPKLAPTPTEKCLHLRDHRIISFFGHTLFEQALASSGDTSRSYRRSALSRCAEPQFPIFFRQLPLSKFSISGIDTVFLCGVCVTPVGPLLPKEHNRHTLKWEAINLKRVTKHDIPRQFSLQYLLHRPETFSNNAHPGSSNRASAWHGDAHNPIPLRNYKSSHLPMIGGLFCC
jgi:hypothetical protein